MKHLKLLFVAVFILLPALCPAADDGYGYPVQGPYASTILGTPSQHKAELPAEIPLKRIVLDVIPDREKPDVFFYDEGLRFSVAFQDQKAPLVFLIPGTGANEQAPRLLPIMKQLYAAGYHVIALPNPTHPNFIISGSQSRVPGDLAEDAADIYTALEKIMKEVKEDIEVSDFSLAGYSLGGTQAAFVAKLDEERKSFNFQRVLMINPAVSLHSSVSRIEALLDRIPGGPRKIGVFFNATINKFMEFYRVGDFIGLNDQFLYSVYKTHLLSQDEAGGIIALAFRISSAGMIFASDVMTNGGYIVPKNRVLESDDSLGDYFRVGVHLSFLQYFDEYFFPHFQKKRPGLTREALIEAESLKSIEAYLKSSNKFGVMTNENDFILSPDDLAYLRTLFGERAKVYSSGGHLGNLEYKDNMAYLVDFFRSSASKGGTKP
jgi:hypothetical protein